MALDPRGKASLLPVFEYLTMHDLPSSTGRPSRKYILPEASYIDEPLANAVHKVKQRSYMHCNSLEVDAFRRQ